MFLVGFKSYSTRGNTCKYDQAPRTRKFIVPMGGTYYHYFAKSIKLPFKYVYLYPLPIPSSPFNEKTRVSLSQGTCTPRGTRFCECTYLEHLVWVPISLPPFIQSPEAALSNRNEVMVAATLGSQETQSSLEMVLECCGFLFLPSTFGGRTNLKDFLTIQDSPSYSLREFLIHQTCLYTTQKGPPGHPLHISPEFLNSAITDFSTVFQPTHYRRHRLPAFPL